MAGVSVRNVVKSYEGGVMAGHAAIAQMDPHTSAASGQPLPLAADMAHMHLMDPSTGAVV